MTSRTAHVLILLLLHLTHVNLLTISDTILDDTKFYYRKLTIYPSKKVTIEFSLSHVGNGQILDLYTFDDNPYISRNCSYPRFGQLRNEDFIIPLGPARTYRFLSCDFEDHILECHGKTTVQDYKPRHFAFSFGFHCEENFNHPQTLKGLTFNITLYEESNNTECSTVKDYALFSCARFYTHNTFPNLVGLPDNEEARFLIKRIDLILKLLDPNPINNVCHQHFEEILCYILNPKCNYSSNQIIPSCRETCHELFNGCLDSIISHYSRMNHVIDLSKYEKYELDSVDSDDLLNCDYLPSVNGSIPCFYKPVICDAPLNITNAVIIDIINDSNVHYPLHSQIKYSCQTDQFQMEGNETITCQYSGQWSEPPKCSRRSNSQLRKIPLDIVLPVLIIPFVVTTALCILVKCRQKRKLPSLTRIKTFDAFVCYAYEDHDVKFAEETLRTELEETQDPPFKLCLHRRDFKAAWDIMWNIRNAITNSNSAIIIMSQDYINSLWCKEEFEQCYMENMKDPAFKLFVIMLQPADSLEKLSEYMKSFFSHKTYLEKDDPKFIKKISEYLTLVKKPKQIKKCRARNTENIKQEGEGIEMEELL